MSETTPTAAASVAAPATGQRLERSIGIKFFRDGPLSASGKPFNLGFEVLKRDEAGEPALVCGVVLGRVIGYKRKEGVDAKTGEVRISTMLNGMFEATRTSDGKTMQAPGLYLTSIFIDAVVAEIDAGNRGIDFAVQISAEKNPQPNATVPYAWVYHDLVERKPTESPLTAIKRSMMAHPLVQKPALSAPAPTPAIEHDAATPDAAHDAKPAKGGKRAA